MRDRFQLANVSVIFGSIMALVVTALGVMVIVNHDFAPNLQGGKRWGFAGLMFLYATFRVIRLYQYFRSKKA